MRYIVLFIVMMLVSWMTFAASAAAPHWTWQDVELGFFIGMFTSFSTMPFPFFFAIGFIALDLAVDRFLRAPWDMLVYVVVVALVLFVSRPLIDAYVPRFATFTLGTVILPAAASAAVLLLYRLLFRSWRGLA